MLQRLVCFVIGHQPLMRERFENAPVWTCPRCMECWDRDTSDIRPKIRNRNAKVVMARAEQAQARWSALRGLRQGRVRTPQQDVLKEKIRA